jgi:hypothetical protein
MRRVSYGNATHLNISVEVQPDNKAVIRVALDRRDKVCRMQEPEVSFLISPIGAKFDPRGEVGPQGSS